VNRDPNHRQRSRILFGAFIIAIGLFALLDNLHLFDARLVQPFWPLALVGLGGIKLSQARQPGHYLVGGALVAVGVGLTLQNMGIVHFQMRDLWPVVLIVVGLNVILKSSRPNTHAARGIGRRAGFEERLEHDSLLDASATLSGIVLRNDSQDFRGGSINAVMGGVEIDLRQAAIASEAVLHLSVIMGGVEIRVPREWSISVACTPILGGVEDKTVPPMQPGKRLILDGSVIMGGIEITN
jgi:predicted membrane protein